MVNSMWIRHFDKISFASECVQNAMAIGIEAGNRAHAAAWVKRIVQRGISRYLRISTLLHQDSRSGRILSELTLVGIEVKLGT